MLTESSRVPNSQSVMFDKRPFAHGRTVETSSVGIHGALSVDAIRILIVADLGTSIQIAALVHSIGRFETRIASSPDSALSIARHFLPNIVLLSTDLPDLTGYHLASALRWRPELPSLRLIALTDDISSSDRARARAAGFDQYLTLPVQHAALASALGPRLEGPSRSAIYAGRTHDRTTFITRETHELSRQAPDLR